MGRLRLAAIVLAALALPAANAHAARKPGTFAGSLGVKVPRGAEADVRAVNRASGAIAAARTLGAGARFSLTLPPGSYLVVGTVVRPAGKVVQKRIAVSLRPGQKRKRASLTAPKRKRRPRPGARAAYAQERGNVTPGRIAVEIPNVTGSTGDPEWDAFRGGINDLMINDVLEGRGDCDFAVIEVERRADIIRELEFQQSPYVDPATRVTRNFIIGDVELRGSIAAAPGGTAKVTVAIVDKVSGKVLRSRETTLDRDRDVFAPLESLAKDLAGDLCKLSDVYAVTLDVKGEGRFATHSTAGTITTTLRARRDDPSRNVWRDTGTLQWAGVSFVSRTDCAYIDPVIPTVGWSVTITDAGDDELQVTWGLDGSDSVTASVDCPPSGPDDPDPPPIPGQPGPALVNTGPASFVVPYAGGKQAVSGVIESDGDGFFNSGTITVEPAGVG